MSPAQLDAVLVTYRREVTLPAMLQATLLQPQPIRRFLVVDNGSSSAARSVVSSWRAAGGSTAVQYIDPGDNLGPAGGWALGMQRLLSEASAGDWILTLDDNNPPLDSREVQQVFEFAVHRKRRDPALGGAGIVGARFNWKTGLVERVPDDELRGAVPVDYFGGGHLPMYSVEALRQAGVFAGELFFGAVEVELGLRLRRAGYTLSSPGELWLQRRTQAGRRNVSLHRSRTCVIHWQKYYRIRNYVYMMRQFGRLDLSIRWSFIQCLLKPLLSLPASRRLAWAGFRQGTRACWDGFRGHLGRTVEPH